MKTHKFYTIAIDETEQWNPEVLATHGIKAAFCLYLVEPGAATHCADLTPSSWYVGLRNAFVFHEHATKTQRDDAQYALEGKGVSNEYCPIKADMGNSAFEAGWTTVREDELSADDCQSELWEKAIETWDCHPNMPAILDGNVFQKWEREQNKPWADTPLGGTKG